MKSSMKSLRKMLRGGSRKLLAWVLCLTMLFSMSSVSVFAGEQEHIYNYNKENYSVTHTTYNHGTIEISPSIEDETITLEEGETVDIEIKPYVHYQYRGCLMKYGTDQEWNCPADMVCGGWYCFKKGFGCICDTYWVERTTTVKVVTGDDKVVAVGEPQKEGSVTKVGETANGKLTLTAGTEGTTTVEVSAYLMDWLQTTKTYTVVVEKKVELVSIEVKNATINYATGEAFDAEGMKVVAKYSDGSEKEIASTDYTISNTDALDKRDTTVTISYTEGGVKKTADVDINVQDAIEIVDVDGYTTRDSVNKIPDAMSAGALNDAQVMHVELTFDEAMKIVDKDELLKELAFKFGNITWKDGAANASVTAGYNGVDADLSKDGKILSITFRGWTAAYHGTFTSSGYLNNLVSEKDSAKANMDVSFIVPNGVGTVVKEQVAADETAKASVTTQFTSDSNVTRGMVHLVLLKNGQPAAELNGYGAHITAHWHDFSTLTPEVFAEYVPGWFASSALADEYDIVVDGDTVTITAKASEAGDVLELHVASYLNSGEKTIDNSKLDKAITSAESIDKSLYTEESYARLQDMLYLAKVITTDNTYYAQTDVDAAAAKLNAAIDDLKKLGSEDNKTVPAENDTQDSSTTTGDNMLVGALMLLMIGAAGGATALGRKRKAN